MKQGDSLTLRHGQSIEAQTLARCFQRPVRDIESSYRPNRRFLEQNSNQSPLATTEVKHLGNANVAERGKHCLCTLLTQLKGGFKLLLFLSALCGSGTWVSRPGVKQLDQRLVNKAALMLQVSARDEVPLRMAAQPSLAEAQQLGYFVVADPLMLVVVQYW